MQKPKHGPGHLRHNLPTQGELDAIPRNPIYLVLDNVLDTYNIGSLFRLADAIAATKIYLCEGTEYPPSSRIHKAAVGTEGWVPWEYSKKTIDVVKKLKSMGVQIIAVEQNNSSINYTEVLDLVKFPVAIVVGHETTGVSKKILNEADIIMEFPMYGVNKSLNVWGSAAIAAYKILEKIN